MKRKRKKLKIHSDPEKRFKQNKTKIMDGPTDHNEIARKSFHCDAINPFEQFDHSDYNVTRSLFLYCISFQIYRSNNRLVLVSNYKGKISPYERAK